MPKSAVVQENCLFCKIVQGHTAAHKVFEDEISFAFLDHRPLFPGHVLLVPKSHFETLADLPASLIGPFFSNAQLLAAAVELGMEAEGSFVAANNRISQSVPHFHMHIVPRRKGDGLKGFFWPRSKYKSADQINEVLSKLESAIAQIRADNTARN